MKPLQSRIVVLFLMASASICGCRHDGQMVYTVPRSKPIQVEVPNRVQVKAPSVNVQVPATRPLPPSNGVDVPMVEQD